MRACRGVLSSPLILTHARAREAHSATLRASYTALTYSARLRDSPPLRLGA